MMLRIFIPAEININVELKIKCNQSIQYGFDILCNKNKPAKQSVNSIQRI